MTAKAPKTSFNKRKTMLRLDRDGYTIQDIMQQTGCTYFQVYNVINHRVKHSKNDSVSKEDTGTAAGLDSIPGISPVDLSDFSSPEKFIDHQITTALRDLNHTRMKVAERIKLLKDIIALQKSARALELENYLKRPDPVLIVNIIKRLAPKMSDEEILLVIESEKEKIVRA